MNECYVSQFQSPAGRGLVLSQRDKTHLRCGYSFFENALAVDWTRRVWPNARNNSSMRFADSHPLGLIDLDGVLIDSEPLHGRSWHTTATALGIAEDQIQTEQFRGVSEAGVAERLRALAGHAASETAEIIRLKQQNYEALLPDLKLIAGARDFLETCLASGFRLGLVTSGLRRNQAWVFERFQLGHFFAVVVTGEDVIRGKPWPEPYLRCLELLGGPAAQSFVVEDSLAGVTAAKAAGCLVAAVAQSFESGQLLRAGADLVAPGMGELARWITLLR